MTDVVGMRPSRYQRAFTMDIDAEVYGMRQQWRSREGQADSQCRGCGSFRLDGRPPTVHRFACRVVDEARRG